MIIQAVSVPEGRAGDYRVERFTVSTRDAEFENLRAAIGGSARPIAPGTYTRLMRGGHVLMSDTPSERRDHLPFVRQAHGDVLINGLGLGMCVNAVLGKPDVRSITVVEMAEEVIGLVWDHYANRADGKQLKIVRADALTWTPPKGARYDAVWHDIWADICVGNKPEYTRLHRKYACRTAWQGSWCREYLF